MEISLFEKCLALSFFLCFGAFMLAILFSAFNKNRENGFIDFLLRISGFGLIMMLISLIGCGVDSINF